MKPSFLVHTSLVLLIALAALCSPCFANEHDEEVRKTEEKQAKINAELQGVQINKLEEQQRNAEGIDGVDSVQGNALNQDIEEKQRQQETELEKAERLNN